jgi:hypothetical protein
MTRAQLSKIDSAIADFEQTVFSPVLPGELADWTKRALKSVEQLQAAMLENSTVEHARIFEEISESDPEMLSRVQNLQSEDDSLLQCVRETIEIAKSLQTVGTAVERDELQARKQMEGFVKAAESLSIRLKKQELAVNAWLQESQTRDRGVKD